MKVNPHLWEPHVPKLLEIAGASKDAKTDLVDHLERAQFEIEMARLATVMRPPPRLLKQLRSHLSKAIELLEKLDQYPAWWVGKSSLSWLRTTEDGWMGVITWREALRDIESNIDNPRMGAPAQEDRDIAVSQAAQFFADHSPHGLSGDAFIRFCELFYLAATGTAVDGDMDYAVRKGREAKQRCG